MPKNKLQRNYSAREKWLKDKKTGRPKQVWLTLSGNITNQAGIVGLKPKHTYL